MNQTQRNHAVKRLREVLTQKMSAIHREVEKAVKNLGILDSDEKWKILQSHFTTRSQKVFDETSKQMGKFVKEPDRKGYYTHNINIIDCWSWPLEEKKSKRRDALRDSISNRVNKANERFEQYVDQIMIGDEHTVLQVLRDFRKEIF